MQEKSFNAKTSALGIVTPIYTNFDPALCMENPSPGDEAYHKKCVKSKTSRLNEIGT
jgi:hypothetical protein